MRLALPSLRTVVADAGRAMQRFPLVIAAGFAAAFLAAWQMGGKNPPSDLLTQLLVVAVLGLPLLFAVATLVELRSWRGWRAATPSVAALVVLGGIGWAWPTWTDDARFTHLALLSVVFHLAASFLGYVGRPTSNGFWQFNRVLFLRFLTAALYAVVLFAGLAGAAAAINVLFSVPVPPAFYGRLFVVDIFVFGTWFFVGGIPEPIASLDDRTDYPDGLRKFAQFVLIPLVVLYLGILTAYLAKVVITRVWPSGWIGYLVSYVTVAGILAWLLVRPLEVRTEFTWVRTYSRGFFLALLPSIVMLWMALAKRIGQYGFTERRYIAVMGALWLSGVALFYILSRSRNIAWVPITLCAVTLLSAVGPASAFTVSRYDQMRRLQQVFERNGLWRDGRVARATDSIPVREQFAISEGLRYLWRAHGPHTIDAWLPDSLRAQDVVPPKAANGLLLDAPPPEQQMGRLMTRLGMELREAAPMGVKEIGRRDTVNAIDFSAPDDEALQVTGFDVAAAFRLFNEHERLLIRAPQIVVRIAPDSSALEIRSDSLVLARLTADSLVSTAQRARSTSAPRRARVGPWWLAPYDMAEPSRISDLQLDTLRGRFVLRSLAATRRPSGPWRLTAVGGSLLVRTTP